MTNVSTVLPTVKPAPRNRIFGLGIFPQREAHLPIGPSDADRAWAACELNKDCRDYDVVAPASMPEPEFKKLQAANEWAYLCWLEGVADQMAEEAAWQASYEVGYAHC